MQHFYASVPTASHGNGAAHLTNYALHNVTQRTKRMRDPRMRAIRHVSQLQSLWAGDVGNYKWGGRQPVRRRRGDVHGDMTSVVLRINWPGQSQDSFDCLTGVLIQLLLMQCQYEMSGVLMSAYLCSTYPCYPFCFTCSYVLCMLLACSQRDAAESTCFNQQVAPGLSLMQLSAMPLYIYTVGLSSECP